MAQISEIRRFILSFALIFAHGLYFERAYVSCRWFAVSKRDSINANNNTEKMLPDSFPKVVYLCPAVPKGACGWEGNASEVLEHFQSAHEDLLMDSNAIRADVTQDSRNNRLMASRKGLFLVQTKVRAKKGKLWIRLRFLGSPERLSRVRYGVEITSGKFGFMNGNSCEEYNPVFNVEDGVEVDVQAIGLISGEKIKHVMVKIHVNAQAQEENKMVAAEEVDERVAQEEADIRVEEDEMIATEKEEVSDDAIVEDELPPIDNQDEEQESNEPAFALHGEEDNSAELPQEWILHDKRELKDIEESCEEDEEIPYPDSMIKCTNCHYNMIPPIYMCPYGHSVCFTCKSYNCSVCGQGITDLRNIDLEEHSKSLEYPCRYEPHGCTKKFSYYQIRKHEVNCEYCTYNCELCTFEGRLWEVRSHFRIAHPSTKMYEAMSGIPFSRGSNFVIINNSGVFYCTSRATETYVEWMVVFCGPKERYFSCEVQVSGKKPHSNLKHYFLKRNGNIFKWSAPFDELKSANVKEKYSTLSILCY